jgi:hypothetical protein
MKKPEGTRGDVSAFSGARSEQPPKKSEIPTLKGLGVSKDELAACERAGWKRSFEKPSRPLKRRSAPGFHSWTYRTPRAFRSRRPPPSFPPLLA